jgi:hypothetical protein
MPGGYESAADPPSVDVRTRPRWMRTGYRFFPYAALESGQWWVLRINFDFPAHDMYTLFVDGAAVADITGSTDHPAPLLAGIAALKPFERATEPVLDPARAEVVVSNVAQYADYGSEHGDPDVFCDGQDGTRKDAP